MSAAVRSVLIPRQRLRTPLLSALLVSPQRGRRRSWSKHLRGVGIGRIFEATVLEDAVAEGRPASKRGICLVEAALQNASMLQTIRELREQGWDRLVLVTPRGDIRTVRIALASRIRSLVVNAGASGHAPGGISTHTTESATLDLSEREVQVVQLVANGHTNREVGEELNLSALTVKSHLSRIGRKVGTGDRAQIVATCMRTRQIT